MDALLPFLRLAAVMVAAIMLGRLFLAECRKARAAGSPWYRPYLSFPGLLVLALIVGLPFLMWFANR